MSDEHRAGDFEFADRAHEKEDFGAFVGRLRGVQGLNPLVDGGQLPAGPAPFACRENEFALMRMQEALLWLQLRTRNRIARGVEGQQKA